MANVTRIVKSIINGISTVFTIPSTIRNISETMERTTAIMRRRAASLAAASKVVRP